MADHNNHSAHHGQGADQLLAFDEDYYKEFETAEDYNVLDKNKTVELECYQSMNVCCGSCTGFLSAWLPCICCCFDKPFVQIPQSSKSIIERFGKPIQIVDSGLTQINTCTDQVKQVSMKTRILELPQQRITTKDNIILFVDAVIYYRVIGILRAVYRIENLQISLLDQSVASIRSIIGEMTLNEILNDKEGLALRLEYMINQVSKKWGTLVEEILFKDIALNKETQSDMAATAKQRRLGETKLISNKAEVQAAALLKQTAEILDSKAAMQVRYLEVIQNITKSAQEQVIFLPLDPTAGTVNGGGYKNQNKK
ncbi:SPFH domain/band 7 family protein (macronuclear) [Tetrahymena thermophila SB210]|uniref:SPFH domain/band 7 family protein n=1 Tax=Tetrahymena thermophila (strain SB210) TaxID=312017 RepID=Q22BM4_TETTS|nr:SPFH domain/band 7 family protein [Tetrahymena thermophila SB210]EAR82705.2 SPFH domain/band 7 family protein [Tetrahymena thermophila SB210]|eukprot:XP_001030368.2 SPFH domain/band 7 family protein [Tetrahymena thermophila SB210]